MTVNLHWDIEKHKIVYGLLSGNNDAIRRFVIVFDREDEANVVHDLILYRLL